MLDLSLCPALSYGTQGALSKDIFRRSDIICVPLSYQVVRNCSCIRVQKVNKQSILKEINYAEHEYMNIRLLI